jgi:NRPS condensation-like uncharacterized protein
MIGLGTGELHGGHAARAIGRFGVVDELTCCYDRPAEPANVHVEAWLPGGLEPDAVRASVLAVLGARPRARVRRAAAGRWRPHSLWECPAAPDVDPVRITSWQAESDLSAKRAAFLSRSPSLDTSPPVRFLLATGPDRDCLILNAHHAALDGLSSLGLLRAVAAHYSEELGYQPDPGECHGSEHGAAGADDSGRPTHAPSGDAPAGSPVASGRFRAAGGMLEEGAAEHGAAEHGVAGDGVAGDAVAAGRVWPGRIARIARQPDPAELGPARGYGACLVTWQALPAAASRLRALGGSVNDLLIAAMMSTIRQWNDANDGRTRLIRITMPVSDRDRIAEGTSGAWGHLSRLTAVAAPVPRGSAASDLITAVSRQTRYAKEHPGPQVDLPSRVLARLPVPVALRCGLLRAGLAVAGSWVCDTSLVSNLGVIDPPRFGPAAAWRVWFSTSAHLPRGLSLGAVTTSGQLHLTFRYRRAAFGDAAAAAFASLYMKVLDDFAGQETFR